MKLEDGKDAPSSGRTSETTGAGSVEASASSGKKPTILTRNDQLTMKSTRKANRKQKKGQKKAGKGKKRGGNKRNSKKAIKPSSPQARRRKILQSQKRVGAPDTKDSALVVNTTDKPKKRKSGKQPESSEPEEAPWKVSPKGRKGEVAPHKSSVPKAKAKAKGKAKAKAQPKAKGRPTKSKVEKNSPKDESEQRPQRKRGRPVVKEDLYTSPLYDEDLVQTLCSFASMFDSEADHKSDSFKKELRSQLAEDVWLNIYWTRQSCGVRSSPGQSDTHHFSFATYSASASHKTAVAVKCAELTATGTLPKK